MVRQTIGRLKPSPAIMEHQMRQEGPLGSSHTGPVIWLMARKDNE